MANSVPSPVPSDERVCVGGPKYRSPGWLPWVFLAAITLLVYLPVWSAEFIWDDDQLLIYTPEQTSPHGLMQIWLSPGFMAQYYPLTFTTHWIEQKFWGLDPTGYHATNVLLHVANALLVWRLLRRLGVPGAYAAALLFALHPVNVESVAWVAERKNTLSTCLYLLSAIAYLNFTPAVIGRPVGARRKGIWYAAAIAAYVGALLSKSVTCSLPAAILVVIWWKHGRLTRRDVLPLAPFLAIGLLAAVNTAHMEMKGVGATGPEWAFSPAQRVLIAGRAVCFYVTKLAVPWPLNFNYPRWALNPGEGWQWAFPVAALGAIALLLMLAVRYRLRAPLAGALLFVGTLTPALGFFNLYPMRFSFVADHFQYLAMVPMLALSVAGATVVLKKWRADDRFGIGVVVGVASVYATLSFVRADVFHDQPTLWRDTIAKNPRSWLAYDQLAAVAVAAGETEDGIRYADESLRINPDQPEGHLIRGGARMKQNDAAGALVDYRQAAALRPENFQTHRSVGQALLATGDVDGAIAAYERVFALEPRFEQGRLELAQTYLKLGRPADAETQYRQAIAQNARSTVARASLAGLLYKQGRVEEAILLMTETVAIDRRNAVYENNLGAFLESRGRVAEAATHYRRAAELKPEFEPAVAAARRLQGQ